MNLTLKFKKSNIIPKRTVQIPSYFNHKAKIVPRIDNLESILYINIVKFKINLNLEIMPNFMSFMNI